MAQTVEGVKAAVAKRPAAQPVVANRLDRRVVDLLISWAGAVVAAVLIGIGAAAMYGGAFAMDNVHDRLEPQNITFKATAEMTPAEAAVAGEFGGQTVTNGAQAEAFANYIGVHLADVNGGKSYSETSAEARAIDAEAEPELAAEMNGKVETLFRGEMLRGTLLNAYAWWTVGQITLWVGFGALIAGLILAVFVGLGFRHARKTRTV